jgi:hypothetical protein
MLLRKDVNRTDSFAGGLLIYRINRERICKGNYDAGFGEPDEIYCYRPNGTNTNNGAPWQSAFNAKYLHSNFSRKTNPAPVLFDETIDNIRISNVYEDQGQLHFTYHSNTTTFIKLPLDNDLNVSRKPVII